MIILLYNSDIHFWNLINWYTLIWGHKLVYTFIQFLLWYYELCSASKISEVTTSNVTWHTVSIHDITQYWNYWLHQQSVLMSIELWLTVKEKM